MRFSNLDMRYKLLIILLCLQKKRDKGTNNVKGILVKNRALFVLKRIFQFQPRNNIHGLELLKQQFASVGNPNGRNVHGGPAIVTPTLVTEQSTLIANIDVEGIGRDHQPLYQQIARSISNQTISFGDD